MVILLWSSLDKTDRKTTTTIKNEPIPSAVVNHRPHFNKNYPLRTITRKHHTLQSIHFEQLPGWNEAQIEKSLLAFQGSCKAFLKQKPNHPVGSQLIHLKAGDWQPACREALSVDSSYEANARTFFETWFYPIELSKNNPEKGVFTGYYMPELKGNLTKTTRYNTPIYGLPEQSYQKETLLHYTRAEIDKGALNKKAPVIAWIESPIERLFLEIEGAGVIQLPTGKKLYLGYAGENGAPYSSISHLLIKKGVMTKDNASKTAIKRYLESQPQSANRIIQQNKSFVFFQKVPDWVALGAHGKTLTPGYSLAIDKKWIPLGAPLWLKTSIPNEKMKHEQPFQRLMIAQDTGGAIKGLVRGDIFWGSGKKAAFLGENMKHKGRYWLLLPKHAFERLAMKS